MRAAVILISFGLMLAGCPAEKPAEKPNCGPNGTYVEADGGAYCECYDGFCQGEGLVCISCDPGRLVGESCDDDVDCVDGRCLKYPDDTEGYCTTTNCVSDSDCVNHAAGETAEMCCVEVEATYFICIKIAEGYECGDGTGTCGSSCTGTVESACDVDHTCLRSSDTNPSAACSRTCETYHDCTGCLYEHAPNIPAKCIKLADGQGYCLFADLGCSSTMDCPEGETCAIAINADRTILFGDCVNSGALPPGAACNDEDDPDELAFENRCSSFYCFGGMCSEACEELLGCPEGMSCQEHTFEDVDDSIMVCKGD
ncbi:MAG: hypothetical protein JRF33_05115 [Deltaproteobacteria bacterium]|nr:hypothetical protein [Deltaproteobacteria bacterium]